MVLFVKEKRREGGAKSARVPVPVRSGRGLPVEMMREMRERYWCSSEGAVSDMLLIGGWSGS